MESVTEHPSPMGWTGVHLMLKSDAESLEVHVGPSAFLAEKKFALAKGDEIVVLGSKVKLQGNFVLLAREIKKGDRTLVLRNAQGIPQWSGGRRRP